MQWSIRYVGGWLRQHCLHFTDSEYRLEQRGLVTRSEDAADRRARVVSLTRDGKARITHVFAGHKTAMECAAQGLSKAERGTLIELLRKLGTTAERQLTEGDTNHDDHPDSE